MPPKMHPPQATGFAEMRKRPLPMVNQYFPVVVIENSPTLWLSPIDETNGQWARLFRRGDFGCVSASSVGCLLVFSSESLRC